MRSEANDDILVVHHWGKTNCLLRYPDVVAENQKEVMRERTHSITEDGMHRYNRTTPTAAFRTTPTAALIGLTPLPLWIEGEARASYFRICRFGNATQRGNIAHLNFSRDTVLENMFK